jgi:hypothetical protein
MRPRPAAPQSHPHETRRCRAELRRVFPRPRQHLGRHVDADDTPLRANDAPCHEGVDAGSGAEIKDDVAGLDSRVLCRQPAAEAEIGVRNVTIDRLVGIADHVEAEVRLRQPPARSRAATTLGRRGCRCVTFAHDPLDFGFGVHGFTPLSMHGFTPLSMQLR